MQALLTVIVTWLSINFALPAVYEHPQVAFVPAAELAQMRSGLVAARSNRARLSPGAGEDIHAFYDDPGLTIYLPEGWTAASPAEVSILVHELVHHLQNRGDLHYACAEAREKPAYQAQTRWLELFGKGLEEEFQIDAMTLLLRSKCFR